MTSSPSFQKSVPQDGIKRVLIKNIVPSVDCGPYPAKALIHIPVKFEADIFADGHDRIFSRLMIKAYSSKIWTEIVMRHQANDRWEAYFTPSLTGRLDFKIEAWINELDTWRDHLDKKTLAGLDTSLDRLQGLEIIRNAGRLARQANQKIIYRLWDNFQEKGLKPRDIPDDLYEKMIRLVPKSKVSVAGPLMINVDRKKAGFSTWYELFPRSTATKPGRHGTFGEVSVQIPRLAEAGFDVLYLPPIHPIGRKNRKGKNNSLTVAPGDVGSPWAIGNEAGGHKAIHPELGTLSDFRKLIKTAERWGMEVAMDIAFQCAPDHPYVKEHPEWFKWLSDGTIRYAENPPKKYEDIIPFNFESEHWPELWEELRSIFLFWIRQGIRIFRVDNPHTKPLRFWEWLISGIKRDFPETLFLAEAFTRPRIMEHLAAIGFTQSYTYFTWRHTKAELESYLTELTTGAKQYFFRPNFWPNTPDILPPYLVSGGENMHIIRLLLAATLSSNYGVYGPVYERGINQPAAEREEYRDNEKYEIKYWESIPETRIWKIMKQVNHIRHRFPALQLTNNISFLKVDNNQMIAFLKEDIIRNSHLIVIINMDPEFRQSGWLSLPKVQLDRVYGPVWKVCDQLNDEQHLWAGAESFVILDPYTKPAHIFSIQSTFEN